MATVANYMTTPQVNTSSAQQNQLPQVSTDMGGNNRPSSQMQPQQPSQSSLNDFYLGKQNLATNANNGAGTQPNSSQWSLPTWNPSTPTTTPNYNRGTPATHGGGVTNFFNATDPWSNDRSNDHYNNISNLLPVAQLDQNNYQYMQDSNEAQRRWNLGYDLELDQFGFARDLALRQQLSAEKQADLGQQNWSTQFDHTREMDLAGLGLSQQQIDNALRMGLDQNQATRDVAGLYSDAQRYGADQQLAGQLGSASMYSDAQRYGADQQLAGQLGSASMYSDAQRYGADQGLAGTRYQSDTERAIAQLQNQFLYQQLAQQAQQAQYERENQMAMANVAAYGRSQAPSANWARNWA